MKTLSPQRYVAQRASVPADQMGNALATMLEEVWKHLNQQPSVTVGPAVVRYHGVSEGDVFQVEAGFPIGEEEVPQTGRIACSHLPGGAAATMLHWGPYDGLAQSWADLEAYPHAQQLIGDGPRWEIYWVDPSQSEDQAEWRTELVWPVRE